jgi:hypothetical protein
VRRLTVLAWTLLALGLAGGCGSDDDGTKGDPRSAARSFILALGRENYREVCDFVAPSVKRDWADVTRRNPQVFSNGSCPAFAEDFYGRITRRDQRRLRRALRLLADAPLEIKGKTAVITLTRGKAGAFVLEKVNGRWLMTTRDA